MYVIDAPCDPSGIEEQGKLEDKEFRLLPNRRSVKLIYMETGKFSLYNIAGRKVNEANLVGKGEMTFKVPGAGIYFGILETEIGS
ncbi:MAG: hypothetical protein HY769_08945, partial [Candidatus Stahlbacteria bacterium]|nr:hypothetical protein [Candidatus Stahlbacteria bacterium]